MSDYCVLGKNKRSLVVNTVNNRWGGVKTNPIPRRGIHTAAFKFENCTNAGFVFAGVVNNTIEGDKAHQKSEQRWTCASNGNSSDNGVWWHTDTFQGPATITVTVDMNKKTVQFMLNKKLLQLTRSVKEKVLSQTYLQLPEDVPELAFIVGLNNHGESVSIL
eukprot:TRINITY_DN14558_c0_g1_i1.p2 TRINITY_DN14558_c0_g1~~TRINITY_DN14558_c0_g1_i1.p2  ORF type:complete len:162 (-),score=23.10 TRINITY_DN14558_c0_g1_i1:70-555(-)